MPLFSFSSWPISFELVWFESLDSPFFRVCFFKRLGLQGSTLATEWSPLATVNLVLATVKKSRSPNWRLWYFPLIFFFCNTVFFYEWWPKGYRTGKTSCLNHAWHFSFCHFKIGYLTLLSILHYKQHVSCISYNLNHSYTSEVHTSGAPRFGLNCD